MVIYNELNIEEYTKLLNSVGWKIPSLRLLKISLESGINVKYVNNGETIGMARFVTDGGYAGLLMDVVVHPDYQGNGYGKMLIKSLLEYIKKGILPGEEVMIQLLSAPNKQSFIRNLALKLNMKLLKMECICG